MCCFKNNDNGGKNLRVKPNLEQLEANLKSMALRVRGK